MGLPTVMTARRRAAFALLVVNGFLQAALSLGLVLVVRAASHEADGTVVPSASLAATALGLGLLLFGLRILQKRQGETLALGYTAEIRLALVEQTFALPAEAGKARLGLMMTRLITDLSAIKNWLADGLATLFVAIPSVSTITLGAFFLAPGIAPFLLAGVLVWLSATLLAMPFLAKAIRESRKRRGHMSARLGDIVLERRTLALFGRAGSTTRRVERMSAKLNTALVARAGWSGTARAASDLVLPAIVATLTGIALAGMPATSAAELGILLLLSGLVVAQLADLARAADYRLAFREARRRLAQILDLPGIRDPENPVPLHRTDKGRAIRVDATPDGGGPVQSFSAEAGDVVAVTGGGEADRRAFLQAISEPSDKSGIGVHLDGIALTSTTLRDRRRAITLISPSLPLIRASVVENVAIGAPSDTSEEEAGRVAGLAGIDASRFADTNPLDPGNADPALSTAIRVARALLRKPSVLVIDDPDLSRNETLMGALLEEARARRTTVVLSSGEKGGPERADRIWDISAVRIGDESMETPPGDSGDE